MKNDEILNEAGNALSSLVDKTRFNATKSVIAYVVERCAAIAESHATCEGIAQKIAEEIRKEFNL